MKSIQRTRQVLIAGRWFLILGLVFYSLMTTTPFVSKHSEWDWSGWALGLIVDAAFIMSLSAESTLATLGVRKLGKWPAAFRWFTGLSSVFLNIWVSVAASNWVGVAVHLIAPALVMLLAEVGPVYMAALAEAEAQQAQTAHSEAHTASDGPLPAVPVAAAPEPLEEPQTATEPLPAPPVEDAKLPRAEANAIIHEGWRHKLPVAEVAAAAGRHPATVRRKFKEFEASLS